ncbi:DUF305 domain-containing protein [Roseitranquillus sediminis]|uniref:DUF305 domain-containing protein n=1 Tax=Roseitranquillus sediminis TaxID=2809051 RepID=UPI001D0CA8CD|nr:DUF305 domain-containing protein [Roseitranquillus sediminis]MBM9594175.1 DUF305 domain-containing protein [Roseitranquillus sediminis]
MSYIRFGLMILTSTVVMFILMYLNTYAWEHLFFSETRTYMALMMGATMAVIMLAYMLGMYSNMKLNIAIFVGAAVVFALMLWLVRGQATVSGPSYMRAMIPHHSIAVMTSERAQIRDPRVAKLAHEIILAQRREIAEMRYLIAEVSAGNVVESVYEDPLPEVGTIGDALSNVLVSTLDPSPLVEAEADQVLGDGPRCVFNRSPETDPILWASAGGNAGVIKLNGVIVPMEAGAAVGPDGATFVADGATATVRPLGAEADWRSDAELVFELERGLQVGYRGFYTCE